MSRELLKVPEHFARIDTLVMADSLYAGYEGDPSLHHVDPALMEGFRRFHQRSRPVDGPYDASCCSARTT